MTTIEAVFATFVISEETLKGLESIFKILAYFAAAIFFLYKAITGYFIVNLTLAITTYRQHKDEAEDYLFVSINLSKGDRSSVLLHDIRARFNFENQDKSEIIVVQGIDRLSFKQDKASSIKGKKKIEFGETSKDKPFLRLSAGEATLFSCAIKNLPKNELCNVEVVVLAKKNAILKFLLHRRYGMGQWRGSTISLPIVDKDMD